ncbi:MAG: GNAT family N-acetyltransferase [Thermomicrobium sp.]
MNDCTLVAEAGPENRIVGVATYYRLDGDRAEVALAVTDACQGRGLGTILLGHLAEIAGSNGIRKFVAWFLPENDRMIQAFLRSWGFQWRFEQKSLEQIGCWSLTHASALHMRNRHSPSGRGHDPGGERPKRALTRTQVS